MNNPAIKSKFKDIILESLNFRYVSESCQDNIKTGNHYQSIRLGDEYTKGFRTDRNELLDLIDFKDKKVLDLGCNLGEMSRSARYRGASLVDGFEYDEFFIEIGNMVNAYNETKRVSFFQRDITDPSIYTESYDIVLGFSVFTYISPVISKIADITKGVFILETHQLKNNLESVYLNRILPYFKFHKIIAETDWGTNKDSKEIRVVIVFSNDQDSIESVIKKKVPSTGTSGYLDLHRSRFKFIEIFFEEYDLKNESNINGVLKNIAKRNLEPKEYRVSRDYRSGVSGWIYWTFYLKGYVEYLAKGYVNYDNEYVTFLKDYYHDTKFDPEFGAIVAEKSKLLDRITKRYKTTELMSKSEIGDVHEIFLFGVEKENKRSIIYIAGDNNSFSCSHIDGYHRVFSAYFFGIKEIPFVIKSISD